jgi:GR25 family glycosyltransferase involved in LPS biosynthesis
MKYTIIHVNDRADTLMWKNKKILQSFEHVDAIEFINGNLVDAKGMIQSRKINTDSWNPYDGRKFPPLPGEYGYWASLLNILDYVEKYNLSEILILEDDAILTDNSAKNITRYFEELPDGWDFLSLFYFDEQNQEDRSTNIGKKYIHKSTNQLSGGVGLIISNSGAKKINKLLRRVGLQYTGDCFIFHHAILGSLSGYSIKPSSEKVLLHSFLENGSVIDPDNKRVM